MTAAIILALALVLGALLGLVDVFPGGHLRFITGVEALNGLLLISWSGSFVFIAMGKLWPWERRRFSAPKKYCGEPDNLES